MRDRGLEPDFPPGARAEAAALDVPPTSTTESVRDLRSLLWCSIDNDDSRDLDQLSVAEELTGGSGREVKVLVAIADVDAVAPKDSPIDRHAALNTTSVYTPAVVFPMLPEKLSTDLTSLVQDEDRLSIVIELVVAEDGRLTRSDVYGAMVRNRSKLAYNSVDAWLTGRGPLPPAASAVAGMDRQLKVQDAVAQALSRVRHEHGALDFETIEARPQFDGDRLRALKADVPNRAKMLIENLMVAANSVVARFLDARGFPSMRRVVRDPERCGSGSCRWRRRAETRCRPLPIRRRSPIFSRGAARPRPTPLLISHIRSSSCSVPANTSWTRPAPTRRATSGWPSRTTHIRPRQTAAFPISSRNGC